MPMLSTVLTGLSELSIAGNEYITIPDDLKMKWSSLVKLDLEGNRLSSWQNVLLLASYFPCLESLNLKRNAFNQRCDYSKAQVFPHLTAINLADNNIDSWAFIDDLSTRDVFKLQDLRLERNPLHRVAGSLAFQVQAVSRLEHLVKLNGSTVAEKDRLECEIYYVNMCARQRSEYINTNSSPSELAVFDSSNPRFLLLAKSTIYILFNTLVIDCYLLLLPIP